MGVLINKPAPPKPTVSASADAEKHVEAAPNPVAIGASICLAVVCWGAYGPVLHVGQTKMGGSRLRRSQLCWDRILFHRRRCAGDHSHAAPDGVELSVGGLTAQGMLCRYSLAQLGLSARSVSS